MTAGPHSQRARPSKPSQATLPAAAPTLIGVKPRIGISSAPSLHDGRRAEHLERAYTDAVVGAGALPFVLPVLDRADAKEVLSSLDGLLLTGGGDMAAGFYGEDPAHEAYGVDAARDTWELALAAAAGTAGLPVLGVCRGAQLLNVAAGGTLIQHLPVLTDEPHREYDRDRETVHTRGGRARKPPGCDHRPAVLRREQPAPPGGGKRRFEPTSGGAGAGRSDRGR